MKPVEIQFKQILLCCKNVTIRNLNNKNEPSKIESCSKNDFDLINIHDYSQVFPSLKLLDIQNIEAELLRGALPQPRQARQKQHKVLGFQLGH